MYVDKVLSGIKAVQTLSRLNRAHPKKHEVDRLLRSRVGAHAARLFPAALDAGEHDVAYLSPGLRT